MALVAAKCTECAASIEVDDCKEAGICNFCGTAFVTKKIIQQTLITKNVFGDRGKSAEDFCADGETFLKLKDWEKAEEAFDTATTLEPSNYIGWLGLVKVHTENFTSFFDSVHIEYYEKSLAVAKDESEKVIINETYEK
ncbi:MAG: tetratricopeptide repeat protein [Firmicutes bacterium]|nr:tetratricopeptide repeat protein [Bacillota bacterium]